MSSPEGTTLRFVPTLSEHFSRQQAANTLFTERYHPEVTACVVSKGLFLFNRKFSSSCTYEHTIKIQGKSLEAEPFSLKVQGAWETAALMIRVTNKSSTFFSRTYELVNIPGKNSPCFSVCFDVASTGRLTAYIEKS